MRSSAVHRGTSDAGWKGQAELAEHAATNSDMWTTYQTIRKISGNFKSKSGPIKAKDSTFLLREDEKLEW